MDNLDLTKVLPDQAWSDILHTDQFFIDLEGVFTTNFNLQRIVLNNNQRYGKSDIYLTFDEGPELLKALINEESNDPALLKPKISKGLRSGFVGLNFFKEPLIGFFKEANELGRLGLKDNSLPESVDNQKLGNYLTFLGGDASFSPYFISGISSRAYLSALFASYVEQTDILNNGWLSFDDLMNKWFRPLVPQINAMPHVQQRRRGAFNPRMFKFSDWHLILVGTIIKADDLTTGQKALMDAKTVADDSLNAYKLILNGLLYQLPQVIPMPPPQPGQQPQLPQLIPMPPPQPGQQLQPGQIPGQLQPNQALMQLDQQRQQDNQRRRQWIQEQLQEQEQELSPAIQAFLNGKNRLPINFYYVLERYHQERGTMEIPLLMTLITAYEHDLISVANIQSRIIEN